MEYSISRFYGTPASIILHKDISNSNNNAGKRVAIFLNLLELFQGPVVERQSHSVVTIPWLRAEHATHLRRDHPLVAVPAVDVKVVDLAGNPVRHVDVGIRPRTSVTEGNQPWNQTPLIRVAAAVDKSTFSSS